MIIHSVSSAARFLIQRRKFAHISPVVITEKERDIVRDSHSLVVVVLNLFIQRPYLWRFGCRFAGSLADEFSLGVDDSFQKSDIGALFHSHVAISAHTYSYDIFRVLHALYALCPEVFKGFSVLGIVPRAASVAMPFFLSAGARLMV